MPLNEPSGKGLPSWSKKCICGKLLPMGKKFCDNCPKPYTKKKWLEEQYWKSGYTMHQIANNIGASYVTIWTWMMKHNIPRRDHKQSYVFPEGNHVVVTPQLIEFLDGLILGDGSLTIGSRQSAYYEHGDKNQSYLKWLSLKLNRMGLIQCGNINTWCQRNKLYFKYKTLSYIELYLQAKRWYPNGKKRIPLDMYITPSRLKYWYMGDGNFSRMPLIDSSIFSFEDLKRITDQLTELGLKLRLKEFKDRKRLLFLAESKNDFFRYILSDDKTIPPDYEYKFPKEMI